MKTLALIVLTAWASLPAEAQEMITYRNDPPIINQVTQQPYEGLQAALYWASVSDPNNFTRLGSGVPVVNGIFQGSAVAPTMNGGVAFFTARGWEAAFGATYEAAATAPAMNGRTAILFQCNTLAAPTGGGSSGIGQPPADLVFQCTVVPEPSVLPLLAAGLGAFFLVRQSLSRRFS